MSPLVSDEVWAFALVAGLFVAILCYQTWTGYRDIDRREDDHVDDRHSDAFFVVITITCNTTATAWALWVDIGVIGARPLVLWLGVALMIAGFAFRAWARRVLGRWFHPVVTAKAEHDLIRDGPYRWLRHPIYLGILVSYIGFGVALGTWPSIALTSVPALVGLLYVIHVEESVLAEQLGESYDAYVADTNRFIPGVW